MDKIGVIINLNTLRVEPPFALLESYQAFEVAKAQISGLVNLVFTRQTGLSLLTSSSWHSSGQKAGSKGLCTKHRLIGLGLKLYLSNKQHMFNKDLT